MASLAELQDALVNADKAGDTAAARQLADAIVSMRSTQDAKPAAVRAGESLNGIPRQIGLTARYGMEGLGQIADIATEPLRYVSDRVFGQTGKTVPISEMARRGADAMGLPSPQGANERVIGDATRLVAGAGGLGMAGRAAQAAGGVAGRAGAFFASNPGMQLTSAAGSGLAGGASREAGAGPWTQAGAALVGGLAAPALMQGAAATGRWAVNTGRKTLDALAPGVMRPTPVDQQISLVLSRQGIDWTEIPERVKEGMRTQVRDALNTGGKLNPDALRRMLDFATVGATPTRGMLTQDPVQITREMNLAKTGANSTDIGLQRLPNLQNQNTSTLLSALDDSGARNAPDAFATGEQVIGAMRRRADASKSVIDNLYSQARDTAGRSAPMDGASFTARASQLLDEGLLGGALPKSVEDHLNRIARGEVPFDVNYAEQLKTAMGKLQRASSDGQTRMALGVVRQALEETQLAGMPRGAANPGNLPALQGAAGGDLGQDSIRAFNRARQANRAFMQRVEGTPALAAVIDGAQPDQFVRQFITGQGATVKDVQAMRRAIGDDPATMEVVKRHIVGHLKSAATNATEDVTKFSPAGYNKALNGIGDRKLEAFFSPEEIRRLRAVGRVGTLMTAQPAGSAVNNSNSGALVLGGALSALDSVAGKLPLGLDTMIQGTLRGTQQSQAFNVPRSLLRPPPSVPMSTRVGAPALYGGLLALEPTD